MIIGFVLFFLTGLVFGYAAPKAWAIVPIFLPIVVGLYTGLMDVFDTELVVLMLVGVGVTVGGIVLGRMILYATEGGQRRAA